MPKRAANERDRQQIEDLATNALAPAQIARALDIPVMDVNRMIGEASQRRQKSIDELLRVDIGQPLTLTGDNFMVTSDWHIPETNWRLIERMIAIATRHLRQPRQLIIAGDLLSESRFSAFANLIPPTPWAQERDAAREILRTLLDTFSDVWVIMGNHDRRMIKWSDANLDEKDIFGMILQNPRVHVNKYAYLTIETSTGVKWRVTHPAAYRQARGVTPALLADKLEMNVAAGHEHHSALTFSPSGRHVAMSLGGLYDPRKIAYMQLTDSLKPAMTPGFGLLLDGFPHLFADGLTNWSAWGA